MRCVSRCKGSHASFVVKVGCEEVSVFPSVACGVCTPPPPRAFASSSAMRLVTAASYSLLSAGPANLAETGRSMTKRHRSSLLRDEVPFLNLISYSACSISPSASAWPSFSPIAGAEDPVVVVVVVAVDDVLSVAMGAGTSSRGGL